MKKISILALLATLSVSAFSAVGYLDTQEVFEKYSKTKVYRDELVKSKTKLEEQFKKDSAKLQKEQIELQKKGDKVTEKEKNAFQKEVTELQKKFAEAQEKYRKDDIAKGDDVRKDIRNAAAAVAKTKNMEMVVEANTVIVGGENITPSVIATLEKNYKK